MCEVTSWIPNAVADTLRADRSAQPIIAWLTAIRASIEEYDPLIAVRPASPELDESDTSSTSPDSAFDEILSQLGKEIYKLEEYQKILAPKEKEISLSILNIFDECLEGMDVIKQESSETEQVNNAKELVNGVEDECSDGESTLSDVSFVTSTPVKCVKETVVKNSEMKVPPVPPRRTRPKTPSTSSSIYDNAEVLVNNVDSDSDSASTCWSYKECSADADNDGKQTYAAIWCQSSGYHKSDEILRRVLSQHYAQISRLSFDSVSDLAPSSYRVYALQEVGDRYDNATAPVDTMTPERPTDDDYEPVRDAITDENIYEEIEYGYSFTDEGCSCGGSVEVESCSMSASSEGVGRESPLYANMRDHDAYAITPDVIYWKNLLLDPFYNDDEEDEWITPEECEVYSREQRPPLVIPRITQYRTPRRDKGHHVNPYMEESVSEAASVKSSVKQYERLQDWSPASERSRAEIERSFNKANSDSPPFPRINKRLGNSTENLLFSNPRRPNHLQLPASSSGDSLDLVEIREREPGYQKSRKSRSMVAPKHRVRSPVPTPRTMLQQPPDAGLLQEGPVKRTKFSESGKKSKKNWCDCYMTLTNTALVFYKDYKTYLATRAPRPAGTPPSPSAPRAELVLPLRNAHVVHCTQMYTRRFTRSMVLTVGYDQYLLQDETEENAKKWLINIQSVIYKLGPPMAEEFHSQHYLSSSTDLESLGRTPPAARNAHRIKQKAGGSSNEDLSDSTEASIQKSHVRSILRKFFPKRPAMEVLVKKGIYKDEPVFGRRLEDVCPASHPRVPEFVVACVREIESSEDNMCTDGLYRASGNLSQVQKIRLEIDQNNLSVIESNTDIHVLTGSLKLFFRELKEPLLPYNMFNRLLDACSIKPREAKIKEFRDVVQTLPLCNRDTLKFLLEHLLKVTQYSERNRMHTANLAIVFGPTLMWAPAAQADNIAIDCIQQNNVVDILLTEFMEIFEDNPKLKKKA